MQTETLILGAGAAGLFAAGRIKGPALLLDHAKRPGEKIRISGGGRCNFTNLYASAENYISENKHFAKSALAGYNQWDFIEAVDRAGIVWHEKTLGQLFCDGKSSQIVDMLLCDLGDTELMLGTRIDSVTHTAEGFVAQTSQGKIRAQNLVVATGGKSIPKMGATGLAYDLARQFGHRITETRAGLVPFTFGDRFALLSGLALPVIARNTRASFREAALFTHRGLSGPAALQLSSYWQPGEHILLDLTPDQDPANLLKSQKKSAGRKQVSTALAQILPPKLVDFLAAEWADLPLTEKLAEQPDRVLEAIGARVKGWELVPQGTEGYRTAEVTVGGVSTEEISSKTMQSTRLPGLYFIGEALDVTGWLGGYNFQWAWSSAAAAARAINAGA
ncbi:MAG: aminoacetone oxidase family FAD-binding enzyme [Rhodobacterales bacterium]|nr:MAG: aminoacetone oxidase family FAD-binding enzyme [Rhodobacterales bacterium]PIE09225.1 MAG: aminoacetone oxidase family FAD-binding enzyme [Rhodobacterales bacterium]